MLKPTSDIELVLYNELISYFTQEEIETATWWPDTELINYYVWKFQIKGEKEIRVWSCEKSTLKLERYFYNAA